MEYQAIMDMLDKANEDMKNGVYAGHILSDMTMTIEEIEDRIEYRVEHPPLHEYVWNISNEDIPTNSDLVYGILSDLGVYAGGTRCGTVSYDSAVRLVDHIERDSNSTSPFCAICDHEDNTVYSMIIYDKNTIIMVGKDAVIPDRLGIYPSVLNDINRWLQGYE